MSRVGSRGNATTELRFMQLLKEFHIRGWRRGLRLFGNPDFVFARERLAVFIDGCFWHGCPIACRSLPRTNTAFWAAKIECNRRRDLLVTAELRRRDWRVMRIWEHSLRHDALGIVRRLKRRLAVRPLR